MRNLVAGFALSVILVLAASGKKGSIAFENSIAEAAARGAADAGYGQALNNYAAWLFEQAEYANAEAFYRKAIHAFREGGHTADLAIATCNLGVLYRATGRYALAIENGLAGLALTKDAAQSGHAITCQTNLAEAYRHAGDLANAERAARRALDQARGLDDFRAAHALHTLANVLQSTGRLDEAREICARAVRIRREKLGPQHPLLATTLGTQASILRVLGDLEAARESALEAVRILESAHGADNVHLIGAWNNLAQVLRAARSTEQAEPLYRRALELALRHFGPEHPDYGRLMMNLAAYHAEIGRLRSAGEFYRESSMILRRSLGDTHPEFLQASHGLAAVFRLLGRKTEAASVEKSLRRNTKSFHPGTDGRQNP